MSSIFAAGHDQLDRLSQGGADAGEAIKGMEAGGPVRSAAKEKGAGRLRLVRDPGHVR